MNITVTSEAFKEVSTHIEGQYLFYKAVHEILEALCLHLDEVNWIVSDDTLGGKLIMETWKHIHEFVYEDKK